MLPRKTDRFARTIFKKMSELLGEQIYKKKNGEVVSPPYITIFLSQADEMEWRGAKRQALMEDLESIYIEKVKEIAGISAAIPIEVRIELRVEIGLKEGEVDAEYSWEAVAEERETETLVVTRDVRFSSVSDAIEYKERTIPIISDPVETFLVEVWRGGEQQGVWTFVQKRISIGRHSETKGQVDLHLADDPRIARIHAKLEIDPNRLFWVTAIGSNPIVVGDQIIPINKTVQVKAGQEIQILDFILRLKN